MRNGMAQLSAHTQQQLSPHILTRPATAKHTTDWIYRLSMQTRAVPRREAGVVVLVHWEAGQEPLDQHPQHRRPSQVQMHNIGCIVPSDLLAIL
jgi:hypothetical protein